jgi:hypothetical protein
MYPSTMWSTWGDLPIYTALTWSRRNSRTISTIDSLQGSRLDALDERVGVHLPLGSSRVVSTFGEVSTDQVHLGLGTSAEPT